jgi:alanine racemase
VLTPIAEIDLAAVAANWRTFATIAGGAEAAAVVKADGYGLGAAPISRALASAGCKRFYVSWPGEGQMLREALGPGPEIAAFHGFGGADPEVFRRNDLQPVLNSLADVRMWLEMGEDRPAAVLHLDTGMSRLGLPPQDWAEAARLMERAQPQLILSHLACGDEPHRSESLRQLGLFRSARDLWPAVRGSLSATGGAYLGRDFLQDEIRPGIGLYGGGPSPPPAHRIQNVVRLSAYVLQTRTVEAGATVGYGATWTAQRETRLATIGIGYADGFLRAASNRGYGVIQGERRPILGRVSMDLIVLDVTGMSVSPGEEVELLGPQAGLSDPASHMSTIDYELLTRIGSRVRKVYRG